MLERIETLARLSVARGCGFAMLGIGTTMIGLLDDPAQSLRIGGILSLVTALVLLAKAGGATRRDHRNTELWIMLDPGERPAAAIAQTIVSRILREAYLTFAYYFANGSCVLIVLSVALAAVL